MMSREKRDAELQSASLRGQFGITPTEPVHIKSVLRKENILTVYRPLDEHSDGLSVKTKSGHKFILVNSNLSRGRQHFTIAHEFYHLYFDANPKPRLCHTDDGKTDPVERKANLFASAFLLPEVGITANIPPKELSDSVSIATVLRLEQYYQVSRSTLLIRLKELNIIDNRLYETLKSYSARQTALRFGYDVSLYEKGNEGVVIGDFGEKARLLYENERISEGHYWELLSMIGIDGEED